MGKQSVATIQNLVEWYQHMGVDTYVGDTPRNLLLEAEEERAFKSVEAEKPAAAPTPLFPQSATNLAPSSLADPLKEAESLARAASTLDELKAAMEAFDGCPLKATASQLVFEDGARDAKIMLVGEAPGKDEDIQGKPFVGRAGQLLDLMLAAIGLDRTSVYIANVVPWRPPGNKTPSTHEISLCMPFIRRQVELMNPEALMLLGGVSGKAMLDTDTGITRLRGTWHDYALEGDTSIKALATLHPAFLLRQPVQKKLAWKDFLAFKMHLKDKGLL